MRRMTLLALAVVTMAAGCGRQVEPKGRPPAEDPKAAEVKPPPRRKVVEEEDEPAVKKSVTQDEKPVNPDGPPQSLIGIHGDFHANPVAADRKYAGKFWRLENAATGQHVTEKRDGGYWIVVPIGIKSIKVQDPIYGVECKLSKKGEDQFAAGEIRGVEMVGRVRGTRDFPENVFSKIMVTIDECYFVPKPEK